MGRFGTKPVQVSSRRGQAAQSSRCEMSHMKECKSSGSCKAPVLLCAGVVTLLPSAHVADGFLLARWNAAVPAFAPRRRLT